MIKKKGMSGVCRRYEKGERCIEGFDGKTRREREKL
jgi:hypothetical protein